MNSPSPWAGWHTTRAASTTPARTTPRRSRPPAWPGTPALEAHAFCNTAFLARDAGRPREAVRAAQAGAARAARPARLAAAAVAARAARGRRLGGARRPGGLRAGAGPRARPVRPRALGRRPRVDDLLRRGRTGGPGGAVLVGARRLAAGGPARRRARGIASRTRTSPATSRSTPPSWPTTWPARAPGRGRGGRACGCSDLLDEVQSSRVQTMLAATARVLLPHRRASGVSAFLERHAACRDRPARVGAPCPAAGPVRGWTRPRGGPATTPPRPLAPAAPPGRPPLGRRGGDPPPPYRAGRRDHQALVSPRWPVSFQRSIAGSPYAQPRTDREVGLRRIRAAKSSGRPEPARAEGAQDVPVGEDQHVAVGRARPGDHLVRAGRDSAGLSPPGPRRARSASRAGRPGSRPGSDPRRRRSPTP